MGLRSDAGLLAEEYNPKTNGLMGSFPHPFSHVALETMALDISRQKGPAVRRSRSGASHKPIPVVVLGRRGLYLERAKTKNSAFRKPMQPSEDLARIVGTEPLPRSEVTKKIWAHIKKHDLQNPKNKREILADDKLQPIFGSKKLDMFQMTKAVNKHLK